MSDNPQMDAGAAPSGIEDPGLPNAGAVVAAPAAGAAEVEAAFELPRIARALRHRDFRLFWGGNFLSNIGTWMQNVAQGWVVLKLTGSPFWLGVVGFASSIPILLFALIGGVIADHVNRRKMLIITQSVMMVSAFIMAWLAYRNTIKVYEIVLLALLTGIAMSFNTPSYQALVPELVPREDLTNAIALNSAQFNMSRVVGPTLGGLAMAVFGAAGNFFLNGLSFLAVIVALTRMRSVRGENTPEGGLWDKLKDGFRYVFSHAEMSSLVVLVAIGSLLAVPYLTFVPYFAREVLHIGVTGFGALMACSGAGAFFGAATIAHIGVVRRGTAFVVWAGTGFFSSIILFTFSRSFYLSGFFLMAAGYFMILMVATINSLLQHMAEDHMRGRVMSIYSTAFLGLPPIGSLIAGSLSHVFTAPHVIAGMSAVAMVGTIFLAAKPAKLEPKPHHWSE